MEKCEFKLDKEAAELFQAIGGLDTRKRTGLTAHGRGQMQRKLLEQQKRFDLVRVELSRLIFEIGRYISRGGSQPVAAGDQAIFNNIGRICRGLYDNAFNTKTVLIRSRGLASVTRNTESAGFEIIFGDILLNLDVAAAAVKRQGNRARGLLSQLKESFWLLDRCGISSLFLRLPENEKKVGELIQALQIVAQYLEAVRSDRDITLITGGNRQTFKPALDEAQNPDPNLTLLTILNGLKPATTSGLIQKVDRLICKQKKQATYDQELNVYNAIFRIKKLRGQLSRPPIEVNNLKWLVVDSESETISHVKAQVAKFALNNAGGQQGETARILKSVYGKDYAEIDSREVAKRLQMSSGLLNSIEKSARDKVVEKEVVSNVEKRLEQVNDEVYDSLTVSDGNVKAADGASESFLGKVNTRVSNLVAFFKKRSVTKRKMKRLVNQVVDFDSQDYETLAEDFAVSEEEAKDLLDMLKSCFDEKGNFKKGTFAKIVPEFVRYERRIFEFLWHYLKEAIHQTDRTAFINSLQLLVARLKQPKNALKIILDDLCKNSKVVKFADRKAFMLGNLLVRKYNHELVDYQFTPEDVLDVREGLDRNITAYAQWKVGRSTEEIAEKVNTMHKRLLEVLDAEESGKAVGMDVPYLIGQEREAMIFFSLVGGEGAGTIVFSALNEYGDPGASIYNLQQSGKYIADLLQMLKVLVRGAGRFEGHAQSHNLDRIKADLEGFSALVSAPHIEEMLNQIKACLGGERPAFN